MKKLWQSPKYKAHNQHRITRSLKKLKRKGKRRSLYRSEWDSKNKVFFKRLLAPEIFSVTKNGQATIDYFHLVEERLRKQQAIKIDLAEVVELTPDAIMYLLALMDTYEQQGKVRIKGNAPRDSKARKLLVDSGFYKFVESQLPSELEDIETNVLSIKSDVLVNPQISQEVMTFCDSRLGKPKDLVSSQLYRILLECMGNTKQHAYTEKLPYKPKWWLFALHYKSTNRVNFAILDYGSGIPGTVRRKFTERVSQMLGNHIDHRLVTSALHGQFRTKTRQHNRGKGLPSIYKCHQNRQIDNLVIVSDRAYINYKDNKFGDLNKSFKGTLLSWDVCFSNEVSSSE